jgi:hypothetical protein
LRLGPADSGSAESALNIDPGLGRRRAEYLAVQIAPCACVRAHACVRARVRACASAGVRARAGVGVGAYVLASVFACFRVCFRVRARARARMCVCVLLAMLRLHPARLHRDHRSSDTSKKELKYYKQYNSKSFYMETRCSLRTQADIYIYIYMYIYIYIYIYIK